MAQILAGDIRKGVTFEYKSGVYTVTEFQHVKPGKGAAFVRTNLKNVVTGQVLSNETFNPTTKLETAQVETKKMTYSYYDGEFYVFMDEEYNQEMLTFDQVEEALKYIKENDMVTVKFLYGKAFSVEPENFVELKVIEAEHGVKVNEVVFGPCNYSERMRIIELSEGMSFSDIGLRKGAFLGDDEIVDKDLFYAQLRSQYGDRVCFTKPARLLAEQEYRIMWLVDKVVAESIKVHLPSPRNLATKIRSINLITKEDEVRFLRMLQQRCEPQIADLRRQVLDKKSI